MYISSTTSRTGASLPALLFPGLVTLLGRENKLISSKVDIDAELGRGEWPGRGEGGRGRSGGNLAWNLSHFECAKYVALSSGYWRDKI